VNITVLEKPVFGKPLPKKPLIVIAGPTASGKSALALAVSRHLPAVLINADASQVYRDLLVLSARPSVAEEAVAPHRLFGHIDGAEACTAARWAQEARAEVAEAHAQGHVPVLVGGTGLYLRTLLQGIAPIPEIDPAIRKAVRALPVAQAYQALVAADPEAAARLSPTDSTRVARALEVAQSTGRPLTYWQAAQTGGIGDQVSIAAMILLPPRDWLHARCNARFEAMLEQGSMAEVEALLARQLDPALPVMRAIGVREIGALLAGTLDRKTAAEQAQAATRQYAKRQYTWFRNQLPPDWRRHEAQLNDEIINDLAIKLRDMALTQ
jgi:tRNA dimethylallyltransferase